MEKGVNKKRRVYAFVVIICAILLGAIYYYNFGVPSEPSKPPSQPPYGFSAVILPEKFGKGVFAGVTDEVVVLEANAPQYKLPLDLSEVKNHQVIDSFNLGQHALQILKENGFVVIPWGEFDQIDEIYNLIDQLGIPIFITTDSMLHVYHIFFDEFLRSIEESYLAQTLKEVIDNLVKETNDLYNSISAISDEHELLKEASMRNICFFCVAAKLLDPNFEVPNLAGDLVDQELGLIEAHKDMQPSPLFSYKEDYSQYVPRGHYTRSEALKRYFNAMMWFGRMRFMVKSSANPEVARLQMVQALLLTATLNRVAEAKAAWEKIHTTTAFFVGFPDDPTVYDYEKAIEEVYGTEFNIMDLENPAKLATVQEKLVNMNQAKIVSSPVYPWQKEELAGLRFMGQKFIPDSYMFQELVFDEVTGRLMPKGLDVMAVLNSRRAEEHLSKDVETYPGYNEQLAKLKSEFSELTVANWTQNLYWGWLYSIGSTLEEPPRGAPAFMTQNAWLDEKLNTALGSWAELRHDTILYAKQSYTVMTAVPTPPPTGYVEPLPQLYSRLAGLCNMTINGLKTLGLLDDVHEQKLLEFRSLLEALTEISVKELNGEGISQAQAELIKTIGRQLSHITEAFTNETQKSTLVADVHTDPNTQMVLEEGCGYLDLIIAVYKTAGGDLIATAGPTFSYYEFQQPLGQRLTDEAWIEMLKTQGTPPRPAWTSSFLAHD